MQRVEGDNMMMENENENENEGEKQGNLMVLG